jgi:hypothetical protein
MAVHIQRTDLGIALAPVITAARDQPHAIVPPDHHYPIAVALDLVEPVGTGWYGKALGWNTKFKSLNMPRRYARRACNANQEIVFDVHADTDRPMPHSA